MNFTDRNSAHSRYVRLHCFTADLQNAELDTFNTRVLLNFHAPVKLKDSNSSHILIVNNDNAFRLFNFTCLGNFDNI